MPGGQGRKCVGVCHTYSAEGLDAAGIHLPAVDRVSSRRSMAYLSGRALKVWYSVPVILKPQAR